MTTDVDLFALCASGNQSKLSEVLESVEDSETIIDMRNQEGKSLIELACIFGRLDVMEELSQYGLPLDRVSERGYSLAHWAATWGNLSVLRYLLASGVDLSSTNIHGESPRDIAERYQQTDCAGFLEKEELVRQLRKLAAQCKDIFNDPEKNMGRFTKDEKSSGNKLCDAMSAWVEQSRETSTRDQIKSKITELEQQMEPFVSKLKVES